MLEMVDGCRGKRRLFHQQETDLKVSVLPVRVCLPQHKTDILLLYMSNVLSASHEALGFLVDFMS